MRALVPLGEKSSESVPERVLPYRHIDIDVFGKSEFINKKVDIFSDLYKIVI